MTTELEVTEALWSEKAKSNRPLPAEYSQRTLLLAYQVLNTEVKGLGILVPIDSWLIAEENCETIIYNDHELASEMPRISAVVVGGKRSAKLQKLISYGV
jgi:hypothetical protein